MAQYFTDFSEYTPDETPSDWITHDGGGLGVVRTSSLPADTTAGAALECSAATRMLWDVIGGVFSGNVDVVARMRQTSFSQNENSARLTLHNRVAGSEDYYSASLGAAVIGFPPEPPNRRIIRLTNGAATVLSQGSESSTDDTWYWFRFNRDGINLRVKSWTGTPANEPGSWQVTAVDSNKSEGRIGLMRTAGGTLWVDCFGIGTGADDAPFEPLISIRLIEASLNQGQGFDAALATVADADAMPGQGQALVAGVQSTTFINASLNQSQGFGSRVATIPDPPTGLQAIATGTTTGLATWDEWEPE